MTTDAPSRANNSAVARPMPDAPPVIRATLFSSCITVLQLPARQSSRRLGAIDCVHLSGHIGSIVRGQECEQGRYFFRFGMTPERNLPVNLFKHLVGVLGTLHGCEHVSRRH